MNRKNSLLSRAAFTHSSHLQQFEIVSYLCYIGFKSETFRAAVLVQTRSPPMNYCSDHVANVAPPSYQCSSREQIIVLYVYMYGWDIQHCMPSKLFSFSRISCRYFRQRGLSRRLLNSRCFDPLVPFWSTSLVWYAKGQRGLICQPFRNATS